MITLITIIFFIFGLIIGSFLNVVIYRWNTARSLGGRSACMSCQNKLRWYELIPLISFIVLRGRCRSCKTKISIQYFLVEFTEGILLAALFFKFQDIFFTNTTAFAVTYFYYALMFSILVVIATYDLKHKIIPDLFSLVFGILAFVGLFFFSNYGFHPHIPNWSEFLAGVVIALPFALFWIISRGRWMGLGDAKLAVGLGWLLGMGKVLSGAVLAFWSGAIIGILLVLFKKKYGIRSEIPFAPFLVLGAILAFLFEPQIFPVFNL